MKSLKSYLYWAAKWSRVINLDSALLGAAGGCHTGKVKILLELGADVHARDDRPLRLAASHGGTETVRVLLEAGANIHAKDDEALRWAARYGHTETVMAILEAGADVHAWDDEALYRASRNGHSETVKILLEAGADMHANDGWALRWAGRNGHAETVKILKEWMVREGRSGAGRNGYDQEEAGRNVRRLLAKLGDQKPRGAEEEKRLATAFGKAVAVILADPAVAAGETVAAFGDFLVKAEDAGLRGQAAFRMADIAVKYNDPRSDTAIEALAKALGDGSSDVRYKACQALRTVSRSGKERAGKVLHVLQKALEGGGQDVRKEAAAVLGAIGVKYRQLCNEAISPLVQAGRDKTNRAEVRIAAARGLGDISLAHGAYAENALEALALTLVGDDWRDDDLFVSYAAIEGLTAYGMKYEEQRGDIVKVLEEAKSREDEVYAVKDKIQRALYELGAVPPVAEKTPEEIEAARRAEEERERQADEQEALRLAKDERERERMERLKAIDDLAARLPEIAPPGP